jgi:hypothetical protein
MVSSFSVMCYSVEHYQRLLARMLMSWAHIQVRLSARVFPKSLWPEKAQSLFLPILLGVSQRAHTLAFLHLHNIHMYSIYIFPAALCVGFAMELWCYNSDSCFRTRICYYYSQQECPATILLLMRRAMQKCVICITLWHVSSPAPCKTMRMENFGADCRGSQNIISPWCACARAFDLACAPNFLHSFA